MSADASMNWKPTCLFFHESQTFCLLLPGTMEHLRLSVCSFSAWNSQFHGRGISSNSEHRHGRSSGHLASEERIFTQSFRLSCFLPCSLGICRLFHSILQGSGFILIVSFQVYTCASTCGQMHSNACTCSQEHTDPHAHINTHMPLLSHITIVLASRAFLKSAA